MTELSFTLEQWLDYISLAIKNKELSKVLQVKNQLNQLIPTNKQQPLCRLLYQRAWQAFEQKQFETAQILFDWLAELDSNSWQVQLAFAMLKQQTLGKTETSKQFRNFICRQPIYCYQPSTLSNAINIGVIITSGTKDLDFTGGQLGIASGLTEVYYLLNNPQYRVCLLFIEAINAKDIEGFDCIINAISDSDLYLAQMQTLQSLLSNTTKPIINHPSYSQLSSRDYIYNQNPQVPQLVVPKVVRVNLQSDNKQALLSIIAQHQFQYPLLIRPVGTQNGKEFTFLNDESDINNYVINTGDYYITQYHEFKSSDGYYRKYRCWCIGDNFLLAHLLMSDNWNVHGNARFSTMINNPWTLIEEEDFLSNGLGYYEGLIINIMRELKAIIKLDYFGVDFGLNQNGEFILFEANATMLSLTNANLSNQFPYLLTVKNNNAHAFQQLIAQKIAN
jgi:hypothetical protein